MKIAWLMAAATTLTLALVARGVAGGTPQVAFSPSTATATIGATVPVDVTVAGIAADPGLGGYDLTLTFDSALVRLDSLSDSGFITGGQLVVICVTGQIDNSAGNVNATCTPIQLFGVPGVSTDRPAPLLHASFTALAMGRSALGLTGSLSGPSGRALSADLGSGSIEVSGSAAATGSPTRDTRGSTTQPRAPQTGTGGTAGSSRPILLASLAVAVIAASAGAAYLLVRRR